MPKKMNVVQTGQLSGQVQSRKGRARGRRDDVGLRREKHSSIPSFLGKAGNERKKICA